MGDLDGDGFLDVPDAIQTTDEIIERGGFGSPTFFVNGDDMYFGNDRLELIKAAIDRSKAA